LRTRGGTEANVKSTTLKNLAKPHLPDKPTN
jgi:hypothetical protein